MLILLLTIVAGAGFLAGMSVMRDLVQWAQLRMSTELLLVQSLLLVVAMVGLVATLGRAHLVHP